MCLSVTLRAFTHDSKGPFLHWQPVGTNSQAVFLLASQPSTCSQVSKMILTVLLEEVSWLHLGRYATHGHKVVPLEHECTRAIVVGYLSVQQILVGARRLRGSTILLVLETTSLLISFFWSTTPSSSPPRMQLSTYSCLMVAAASGSMWLPR